MNVKLPKLKLNMKLSFLIIFIVSLLTACFMFYIAPGSLRVFLSYAFNQPSLIFLNYLPIILVMLLLFFITGNSVFSCILPASFFAGLAFANRMKIKMRQDPVVPSDFSVFGEVKSVVSKFDPQYVKLGIAIVTVFVIIIILTAIFFGRGKDISTKIRIIGTAVCVTVSAGLFSTAYSSADIYSGYIVDGNTYFKVNHYISKGFLYSFIYDINNLRVDKPDGYNPTEFTGLENETEEKDFEDASKPNVVMIMSEAFSDISNSDDLNFEGFNNPLEFFNNFVSRDDVISGHIVVPNYGGGTADTEFDVLTACSTRYIDSSQVSYNILNSPLESIPSLLKNIGYDTLAIHPGYGWFYNRINVYDYLGFDNFKYLETSFDSTTQSKGGYISDKATTQSIIQNFEDHTNNSDSPLFEFCVTIQNHGPYGDKYGTLDTNFASDLQLTTAEEAIYSGYFQGVDDADAQIEDLVTYFESSDEPVVLVFFGDHLPGFSNGTSYFSQFRSDINMNGDVQHQLKAYETPYFIWANESARETTDFDKNTEDIGLPLNHVISSSFLGATVMELIGMGDISPFFSYANELRREIPIAASSVIMQKSGLITTNVSADQQALLEKYRRWIYYKMFDEKK